MEIADNGMRNEANAVWSIALGLFGVKEMLLLLGCGIFLSEENLHSTFPPSALLRVIFWDALLGFLPGDI